jgi:membrane dipeptidase
VTVVEESIEARAERVHTEAIIVDTGVSGLAHQHQLDGGISATLVTVSGMQTEDIDEVMMRIMPYVENAYAHPDKIAMIATPDDIRACKANGKIGYVLHFQGMTHISRRLYWVEMFARIGVRVMSLTYNGQNQLGCGAGEPNDTGLTYFGRQVVREMNRAGVVIDLSHLGEQTARDVCSVSSEPVVLTHSSPRGMVNHGRNAPADVMKAVAEMGGVMGISVYAPLMDEENGKFPTVETVLDHVEYAINEMGIDHVGIGTDVAAMDDVRWLFYQLRHRDLVPAYYFEPPYLGKAKYHSVEGFHTPADMPKITRGLVARGFSDEDVKKIMGGNFLRVFDQVWGDKMKSLSAAGAGK